MVFETSGSKCRYADSPRRYLKTNATGHSCTGQHPSTPEAGGSQVLNRPRLQSEFKVILGYIKDFVTNNNMHSLACTHTHTHMHILIHTETPILTLAHTCPCYLPFASISLIRTFDEDWKKDLEAGTVLASLAFQTICQGGAVEYRTPSQTLSNLLALGLL